MLYTATIDDFKFSESGPTKAVAFYMNTVYRGVTKTPAGIDTTGPVSTFPTWSSGFSFDTPTWIDGTASGDQT